MESIIRAYEAQIDDVSASQRSITAVINTGSVDRYRTVIDPAGIDLEAYRKNPVVLWEHGKDPTRGRKPVGRNIWLKRSGSKLVARTEFGKDEYSNGLFEMYRDELLRGWSIFAIPDEKKAGRPTRAEIAARPELGDCECVYRACELGEYSAVAVPGNAETLTLMAERGIWFPEEARGVRVTGGGMAQFGSSADDGEPSEATDDDEPKDAESRYLKKVGDEWGVYAEDGKLLGKHATREEAAKQLAAVEAHKHDAGRTAPELPTTPGRSYEDIHAELLHEVRAMGTEILSHVRDFAELLRGRV